MATCADCGAEIEQPRGKIGPKWAERLPGDRGRWDYCCRSEIRERDGVLYMLSADYHYVEGEEQRHFSAPYETAQPPESDFQMEAE